MIVIAAFVGMPIVLMAVTLAADGILKSHPTKDDVWRLPKVSALGGLAPRL